MRIRTFTLAILTGTLCTLGMTSVASAGLGVDVDLGLSVPVGDDGRLWLDIASRHYDYDPVLVRGWAPRYADPDDFAVALFLARTSGRNPDVIFAMRSQRLSWWDIGLRVGVPVDAWFVAYDGDPGPPYGRAYGYWRKHQRNPKYRVILNDRDCRDLVALRMAHSYYGVPPAQAMQWRRENRNVQRMMVNEYQHRHPGRDAAGPKGGDGNGKKGKTKSGGHGKGHGR